jgi:hypothetical protein
LTLRRHVDLARLQALEQLVRGDVDQHHLVGRVEHGVGHGLPHAHVGDAADDVVQALQVLYVERGEDVDARVEQLLHVLPALRVARSLHVRVRQLIDQDQCRPARERPIEIEFRQLLAAMEHRARREDLESLQQRRGLAPPVRLDDADQHFAALGLELARRGQHAVGLADAGGRAEIDAQLAAMGGGFLAVDLGQQPVGIWPVVSGPLHGLHEAHGATCASFCAFGSCGAIQCQIEQ